jgi:hypothetical protein
MMVKSSPKRILLFMKVSAVPLLLPLAGAACAGALVSVAQWEALRSALLPATSIIAAAVLVRLARGLPFTNADHFTLAQFRSIAGKLEENARKLRALIFVCLAGVAVLVVAPDALKALSAIPGLPHWSVASLDRVTSAIIAALQIYAFARVIEVVHSDVSLLRLQAKVLETVIARKNAASFEKAIDVSPKSGVAGLEGFGRSLQH